MSKQFICKDGSSLYYLVSESAGSFLTPPGHATQKFSIREMRGGHETGFFSLETSENWIPEQVKKIAQEKLNQYPGNAKDEKWIKQVYAYFKNCYSPDGINRNAPDCVVCKNPSDKEYFNPSYHLGYLYVKQYDPNHDIRMDLI